MYRHAKKKSSYGYEKKTFLKKNSLTRIIELFVFFFCLSFVTFLIYTRYMFLYFLCFTFLFFSYLTTTIRSLEKQKLEDNRFTFWGLIRMHYRGHYIYYICAKIYTHILYGMQ